MIPQPFDFEPSTTLHAPQETVQRSVFITTLLRAELRAAPLAAFWLPREKTGANQVQRQRLLRLPKNDKLNASNSLDNNRPPLRAPAAATNESCSLHPALCTLPHRLQLADKTLFFFNWEQIKSDHGGSTPPPPRPTALQKAGAISRRPSPAPMP